MPFIDPAIHTMTSNNYQPTQPYGYANIDHLSDFVAPHAVPPPELSIENKRSILLVSSGSSFPLTTDTYGDPDFVKAISNCQPFKLNHVMNDWRYQDKTKAQEVLPFLFLGPMAAARNAEFIKSNGITMLIAVRDASAALVNPKLMDPKRFASAASLETATFDVFNETDHIRRFRPIVKLINDHLRAQNDGNQITSLQDIRGKVLIFCEAGDTRSAALVILYMMAVFGLDMASAVQAVQARRFSIVIGKGFGRMIQNAELVFKAERHVALSVNSREELVARQCGKTKKRDLDQAYEEDDEVMMDMEMSNAIPRLGIAPFRDTFS